MAEQPPPTEQQGSRGLTLPGYRYLGPLNSLNRGLPRNALDGAAKKHDEKYHKITEYFKKTKNRKQFEQGIRQADEEFLDEVRTFAPPTVYDQVAKWLAQGGIGTKYLIEQATGVIYPTGDEQVTAYEIADMEPSNPNSVVGGGVVNSENVHKFQFRKKFTFAIESTKALYTKTNDKTEYITYIHSLPWQYIFFYMTPKEYQDMTTIFHTAKVTKVGVKITNLGNRTPFVTSANAVNYANANSQTTIGIWENLERTMPVEMGTNISWQTLYGKTIKDYPVAEKQDPEHSTAQAKIISNAIKYTIKNTQENMLLPPLIMESKILFNATNSIGPIYEKDYAPVDGTFHTKHERIHNMIDNKVIRNSNAPLLLDVNSAATQTISLKTKQTKEYEKATIDNVNIGQDLFSNASQGFQHSLGVGIVPLLNADGSLEKAILNIMVETYINLEAISHGTNLLMGTMSAPQPNTNYVKMAIDKKWTNKYTLAGTPVME